MIPFETTPLTNFHRRVAAGGALGQFADAYSVGVIGIALNIAREPFALTGWSMGALAAAALVGVIVGSLVTGTFADRVGRQVVFRWSMLVFTILAVLQYRSSTIYELFALRLLLGMVTGADYVIGKALVTEYAPIRHRGQILTVLSIAWAAGFAASYIVGYFLRETGPDAWRVILLSCMGPSLVAFVLRYWTPESAVWLARNGQLARAREIIDKHIGPGTALPAVDQLRDSVVASPPASRDRTFRRNVMVGCVLQGSLVIPFYALATFLPMVMSNLGVVNGYTGSLYFNILNFVGAALGILIIDRIPRRTLITSGFLTMSLFLGLMIVWRTAPSAAIVSLFAAFAFVIAATGNLQFVYPPELFPTEHRARGIGAVVATSRIGSATSTFFLPAIVENYGAYAALGLCLCVTVFAAAFLSWKAPETLHRRLA